MVPTTALACLTISLLFLHATCIEGNGNRDTYYELFDKIAENIQQNEHRFNDIVSFFGKNITGKFGTVFQFLIISDVRVFNLHNLRCQTPYKRIDGDVISWYCYFYSQSLGMKAQIDVIANGTSWEAAVSGFKRGGSYNPFLQMSIRFDYNTATKQITKVVIWERPYSYFKLRPNCQGTPQDLCKELTDLADKLVFNKNTELKKKWNNILIEIIKSTQF